MRWINRWRIIGIGMLIMEKGVLLGNQGSPNFIETELSHLLRSLTEVLGSDVPPEDFSDHLAVLANTAGDANEGSRRLLKRIADGRYGQGWAKALSNLLKESAIKGNAAPLYLCWLLTGMPRLAAELAEGGWIQSFASHVRVRECLESGNTADIQEMGGDAVPPLINATFILEDPIQSIAARHLESLSDVSAVDRICAIWLDTRDAMIANIIRCSRYIASGPRRVRTASALLNGDFCVASDVDAAGLADLVEWLSDADGEMRGAAFHALLMLKDTGAVNALLSEWASHRVRELDEIVGTAGYVATDPLLLKVLSGLRNERYDAFNEAFEELIHPLVIALGDRDSRIADRAAKFISSLVDDEDAAEAFCMFAVRLDVSRALEIAVRHRLFPRSLRDRALFFFLTEQWTEYESCDCDLSILRQWFEHGGGELRGRIADAARRAGRLELVELVSGARHRRRMGEMTAREWSTALSILRERRDWETMWRLSVSAPVVWAVEALAELEVGGWRPIESDELKGFSELAARARQCKNEPPTIGMEIRPVYQFTAHTRRVSALIVNSYFHRALATGSWDGTVSVWDMRDGSLTRSLQAYPHPISSVAATPDGTCLFAGSGAHPTVVGWTMPEAKRAFSLCGHKKGAACVATSPDGRMLAVGGYDNVIYLWRLSDQRLVALLRSHGSSVRSVSFSPDGVLLASGSEDGEVRLWDIPSERLLDILTGHTLTVRSICFSPDGSSLITGASDNDVIIWDLSRNCIRHKLQGHNNVVSSVAISGDGRVIASSGWDERIFLWETGTGRRLGVLEGHVGPVTCLATDAERRALVSGGHDACVFVWYFQSGIFRRSTRRDEMETVETMLRECGDEGGRPWLEFLLAQMRWRWRFDIQIADDLGFIEVGEFDIEIEE